LFEKHVSTSSTTTEIIQTIPITDPAKNAKQIAITIALTNLERFIELISPHTDPAAASPNITQCHSRQRYGQSSGSLSPQNIALESDMIANPVADPAKQTFKIASVVTIFLNVRVFILPFFMRFFA
jgi:hypothetical protein